MPDAPVGAEKGIKKYLPVGTKDYHKEPQASTAYLSLVHDLNLHPREKSPRNSADKEAGWAPEPV
jgi:hypothetical protein